MTMEEGRWEEDGLQVSQKELRQLIYISAP